MARHQWGELAVSVVETLIDHAQIAVTRAGLDPEPTITGHLAAPDPDAAAAGGVVNWQLVDVTPRFVRSGGEPLEVAPQVIDVEFSLLLTVAQPAQDAIDTVAIRAFGAVLGQLHDNPVQRVRHAALGGTVQLIVTREALAEDVLLTRASGPQPGLTARFSVRATVEPSPVVSPVDSGLDLVVIRGGNPAVRRALAEQRVADEAGGFVRLGPVASGHLEATARELFMALDRAETSGAAIVIDEADALFGRSGGWEQVLAVRGQVVVTTADDALVRYLAERGATVLDAD